MLSDKKEAEMNILSLIQAYLSSVLVDALWWR